MDIFKQFVTLTEQYVITLLIWICPGPVLHDAFLEVLYFCQCLRTDRMTLSYAEMLGENIWPSYVLGCFILVHSCLRVVREHFCIK